MNEDRSTRYHRLRRRAHVASIAVVAMALASLAGSGGGAWLRRGAESLAEGWVTSPVWLQVATVALVTFVLVLLVEVVALPFAYYTGFVLERRYELSRQSASDWWRDQARAASLSLLMAVVATETIYATMAIWASGWWLLAGLLLTALAVLLVLGAPVVLFPLFYRFTPVPPGDLVDRLMALVARAGTRVLGVYRWSLSDKSEAANAALVGLGPTRRVLLSDTLIDRYSTDLIEVIIAHELAHHVHGDIWKGLVLEAALGTLALLAAHVALLTVGPWAGVTGPRDVAGLPLLALVASACSLMTAPFLLAQSRRHERRADRFALDLTRNPEAFIAAMRRLGDQNLVDAEPPGLAVWLFLSHPPLAERIAAARGWAEQPHGHGMAPARQG